MEILTTGKIGDYELLDCGNGEKLERFGQFIFSREESQAIWDKNLNKDEWEKADAIFERAGKIGKWHTKKEIQNWVVDILGIKFDLKLSTSKHLGVFPEQLTNWQWLEEKIKKETANGRKISVLNLFAYTGGATLFSSRALADVVHVDSSEFVVDIAKKNLEFSQLSQNKVRFIVDDVRKFVEREINRGNKYDVVLLDPPIYGKIGTKKAWRIEEDLPLLLKKLEKILSHDPIAVVLNGYASVYSSIAYSELLKEMMKKFTGEVSFGELAIKDSSGRLLPSGIYSRWSK